MNYFYVSSDASASKMQTFVAIVQNSNYFIHKKYAIIKVILKKCDTLSQFLKQNASKCAILTLFIDINIINNG